MNTIKHRAENLNNGGSVTVYYCGYEKCEGGHFLVLAERNQYLLHYVISGAGVDEVPCAEYATFGTPELAASVGAAIGLAVMVLMGYIQLTIISDEVVSLQNQLEELQTENVTLTAQHEQMFDLATVKEVAEAAGMSKPSSSQIYYIDLSEGDSAVVYQQEESNLLSRLLTSLNHGIYAVVEYFE